MSCVSRAPQSDNCQLDGLLSLFSTFLLSQLCPHGGIREWGRCIQPTFDCFKLQKTGPAVVLLYAEYKSSRSFPVSARLSGFGIVNCLLTLFLQICTSLPQLGGLGQSGAVHRSAQSPFRHFWVPSFPSFAFFPATASPCAPVPCQDFFPCDCLLHARQHAARKRKSRKEAGNKAGKKARHITAAKEGMHKAEYTVQILRLRPNRL